MTRHDVEAAAEMANEGLDPAALADILRYHPVRYVVGGFMVGTADGPVTVLKSPEGWTVA